MKQTSTCTSQAKSGFRLLPKIINGGVAGIIGVTCVFPIDLVKTRLQNQIVPANGAPLYSGMIDCFKKSLAKAGFFGMYSGSAVNILLITPEKAIKLSANDYFRHLLTPSGGVLTLPRELLSGAGAGFCQVVVTTPMELLKIQLQDAGRTASEKGSATRIALNIVKSKGILGLYKGTGATIARDVNFSILYFPLFAHINSLGPRKMDNTGEAVFWHSLLSGNVAGAAAAFCVTPFDVVKTRLQLIHRATGDATYKGILDAFRRIAKEEGIFAFFKGAACRMAVMAPLFGVAQMVYYVGVAEWILGIDKSKC
uniref:Mitochondrial carrier protein n=1 Tax=Trichuris muris TaxID=70415 RepID=A0A5S6QSF5_TRIMR